MALAKDTKKKIKNAQALQPQRIVHMITAICAERFV